MNRFASLAPSPPLRQRYSNFQFDRPSFSHANRRRARRSIRAFPAFRPRRCINSQSLTPVMHEPSVYSPSGASSTAFNARRCCSGVKLHARCHPHPLLSASSFTHIHHRSILEKAKRCTIQQSTNNCIHITAVNRGPSDMQGNDRGPLEGTAQVSSHLA